MTLGFEIELNHVEVQRCTWPTSLGGLIYTPFASPTFSPLKEGELDKEEIFIDRRELVSGCVEWGFKMWGSRKVCLELVTAPDLADEVDVRAGTTKAALDMLERFLHELGQPGTWYDGKPWGSDLMVKWLLPECAAHRPGKQEPLTARSASSVGHSVNIQVNFSVDLAYLGRQLIDGTWLQQRKYSPFPAVLGQPARSHEVIYKKCKDYLDELRRRKVIDGRTSAVIWGFLWLALCVLLSESLVSAPHDGEKQRYAFLPRAGIHAVAAALDPLYKKLIGPIWLEVARCVNEDPDVKVDAGFFGFRRNFSQFRADLCLPKTKEQHKRQKLVDGHDGDCMSLFLDTVAHGLGILPKELVRTELNKIGWTGTLVELYDITKVCDTKIVPPRARPVDGSVAVVFEARSLCTNSGSPQEIRRTLEDYGDAAAPLDVPPKIFHRGNRR